MVLSRTLGVVAALCVLALVVGALPSLVELAAGDYVVAGGATLALVAVVVVGGVLAGRRSDRWTDNPYW
jgi:hypothetical protein